MISLTQADLPSQLEHVSEFAAGLPAGLRAVGRQAGAKDPTRYLFVERGGAMFAVARQDLADKRPFTIDVIKLQAATMNLSAHFLGRLTDVPPYTILIRRKAMIVLIAGEPRQNLYVTPQSMSAHERVEDAILLEEDFPGMFALKE